MVRKEIVMSSKEMRRIGIMEQANEGKISQVEAAELMEVSDRQIRRLIKRVKEEGIHGIIHRSRGRRSNRRYPDGLRKKVIKIYRENFHDFGPLLASEKMKELYGITISDETLRQWLLTSEDWMKRRKRKQHRQWRARRERFGEMVQMDGSHHDWFEKRGEKCILMGYIDDATNNVFARFYEYEGTKPAIDSFRRYCEKNGVPLSLYLDKHATYKSTAKPQIEDVLNDYKPLSEFERVAAELGISIIHANSPQAKGRIERLFQTFQDRVIKEMRLAGVKMIEEANEFLTKYLPVFNRKFARMPAKQGNMHKEAPSRKVLDSIFCIKSERVLKNDFTINYNNNVYQIFDNVPAKKVVIEERLNGQMRLTYNGKELKFKQIDPGLLKPIKPFILKVAKRYIPPPNHPWRQYKIQKNEKFFQAGSPPNPPEGKEIVAMQ